MHSTYFPMEQDYKVFTPDHKLIAEGFKSKESADKYIAKTTGQKLYDIYVIWNRSFNWNYYSTYLGDIGLEDYKTKILYQGDGARVKKIKSVLRK